MIEDWDRNGFLAERQELSIFQEADLRLSLLGLTMADLRKYERILDLGAGLGHIGKAALESGLPNVVSAGSERPAEVEALDYKQFNAFEGIPFNDGFFDLVITRKGPLFLSKTQQETFRLLHEMFRVSSSQVRINPIRFGYVREDMFRAFPDYQAINSKPRIKRSPEELVSWKNYNILANKKTEEDLRTAGYKFQIINSNAKGLPGIEDDDFGYIFHTN